MWVSDVRDEDGKIVGDGGSQSHVTIVQVDGLDEEIGNFVESFGGVTF